MVNVLLRYAIKVYVKFENNCQILYLIKILIIVINILENICVGIRCRHVFEAKRTRQSNMGLRNLSHRPTSYSDSGKVRNERGERDLPEIGVCV